MCCDSLCRTMDYTTSSMVVLTYKWGMLANCKKIDELEFSTSPKVVNHLS